MAGTTGFWDYPEKELRMLRITTRIVAMLAFCLGVAGLSTAFGALPDFYIPFNDPGDGLTIEDANLNVVGSIQGVGAIFSTDNPACLESGAPNNSYADFTAGGVALIDQIPFILHDPSVTGGGGDATFEMLFNAVSQPHRALIWSNGTGSDERFHIFRNATFQTPGTETFIGVDYVAAAGIGGGRVLNDFSTGILTIDNVWHHLAIVRIDDGGTGYTWEIYLDGSLAFTSTSDTGLPTSMSWLICGRDGGPSLRAKVDEVRMYDRALTPDEFNIVCPPDCPQSGSNFEDTHCLEVLVNPAPNDPPPPAGTFTITADAMDETGDAIIYRFQVEDSFGTVIFDRIQSASVLNTILVEGAYTLTVTVDDDPLCPDAASDASCLSLDIDVGPPPPFQGEFLTRFEDGIPGDTLTDVLESISGTTGGVLTGAATFSADAPVLSTGIDNNGSMDIQGGGALMTSPFIFHDVSAGGAEGDATLEWFQKVPGPHLHTSIFWTRENTNPDANRFNIYYNANFTNIDGSDDFVNGDQRDPTGQIGDIGVASGGIALPHGFWYSMHITRTLLAGGNGGANGPAVPPTYEWNWYINGLHNPNQTIVTNLIQPTTVFWQISGRDGFASDMLIDEIHGIDRVLAPEELTTIDLDCPPAGDTTCTMATINPPAADPLPPAGAFTVTASGLDDTGEDLLFTYVADNFTGQLLRFGPTKQTSHVFALAEGAWTITVTADDNVFCPDVAAGASCTIDIDVGPALPFPEEVLINFEDGGGQGGANGITTDIVESVSGLVVGELVDGATFSLDTANLQSGAQNDFSGDFNFGRGVVSGTPFVFNAPVSGGASGDASLEWLMKVNDQGHSTIFWTNADSPANDNRYNIFWNASPHAGPAGDRYIGGDANPAGAAGGTPIGVFGNGIEVPAGDWNQVAIVRTDLDGGANFQHDWYYNGQHNPAQTASITSESVPTALTWEMMSRSGGVGLATRGLLDEIHMVNRALTIPEMNIVSRDCPAQGDTTCDGLQIAPPPGNPAPPAGTFSFFATATDGNDDPIFYRFEGVLNGGAPVVFDSGTSNLIEAVLEPGDWEITVTVDDDLFCPDADANNSCTVQITVGPRPPFQNTTLRFEDAGGDGLVSLNAPAAIGTDTPNATIPLTGEANTGSLDTSAGGFATVDGVSFVFHDPIFGGAPGDATLEWYFKTPEGTGHSSFFWTTANNVNTNRFNIFYNASFLGTPDSERFIAGDFSNQDQAGEAIGVFANENPLDFDTWHHVAIVRTVGGNGGANGPPATNFDWTWYLNGVESPDHAASTVTSMPTAIGWLVAGRDNRSDFTGFMDEVRMTGEALAPGGFLIDQGDGGGNRFRRGDHDGSGLVDITDPLNLLGFLFLGTTPPICEDASDGDNSAALDISDALNVLGFLFLGSFPLNETLPGPSNCGSDPTTPIDPDGGGPFPVQPAESLGCDVYPSDVGAACQ
jgi:hypothetical protein